MAENEPVTEGPEELMRQVAELRGQVRHLEFERDILGGTVEIQKKTRAPTRKAWATYEGASFAQAFAVCEPSGRSH